MFLYFLLFLFLCVLGSSDLDPTFYDLKLPFANLKTEYNLGNAIITGRCQLATDRTCPDPDINFFLYTRGNPHKGEPVDVETEFYLFNTNFDPSVPTKIMIHGYNSDMNLQVLNEIKNQYFIRNHLNIFMVDWSPLAEGPCYPAAVWNARFAGECTAQLVKRIMEISSKDIHILGFSLGAHVAGFISNNIKPHKISRITGLDPAMPGFITVSKEYKLDAEDAEFVDVLHTNAFVQGTFQQSGHVDFFMNGGIVQPGCWAEERFFACNHHRAPLYFAESINTRSGFWGWPCPSYLEYLLGRCLPSEPQIVMGEYIDKEKHGVYLVLTNSVSPFAVGKYTGPLINVFESTKVKSNEDSKKT